MKYIYVVLLFFTTNFTYCQSPIFDKITTEICDSLNNLTTPLDSLSLKSYQQITYSIIISNYYDWKKYLVEFTNDGQEEHIFDAYFEHFLQIKCKSFRRVNKRFDTYLTRKRDLDKRPHYLVAKDFIFSLEDSIDNDSLILYLDEKLRNDSIKNILALSKQEINNCKWTSWLSIILTGENGSTFRVRFFNVKIDEPEFQIDINFKDIFDLKIDNIEIKQKNQLMQELKERREFNKKVENGEIDFPEPPPPPKKNKKN